MRSKKIFLKDHGHVKKIQSTAKQSSFRQGQEPAWSLRTKRANNDVAIKSGSKRVTILARAFFFSQIAEDRAWTNRWSPQDQRS